MCTQHVPQALCVCMVWPCQHDTLVPRGDLLTCSLDPSQPCATADSILSGETWSFDYLPGAGDDEESWARRLTPGVLWRHRDALISAGPAGVQLLVSQLTRGIASGALPTRRLRMRLLSPTLWKVSLQLNLEVCTAGTHAACLLQGLRRISTGRCPAHGPPSRIRTQLRGPDPFLGSASPRLGWVPLQPSLRPTLTVCTRCCIWVKASSNTHGCKRCSASATGAAAKATSSPTVSMGQGHQRMQCG